MRKENCDMDNYGKFGKKLLLQNYVPFLHILAFELGKLCPEVGILFPLFRPGGGSFALKICSEGWDFDEKNYLPGG